MKFEVTRQCECGERAVVTTDCINIPHEGVWCCPKNLTPHTYRLISIVNKAELDTKKTLGQSKETARKLGFDNSDNEGLFDVSIPDIFKT